MTALSRGPQTVFVNRFFYPDESATSQILTDAAVHLASRGLDVTVITSHPRLGADGKLARRQEHERAKIRRLRGFGGNSRSIGGKLMQFACFYPAALVELLGSVSRDDVVVAKTDPPLISVVAWIACRLKGARLVTWMQDVYPEVAAELDVAIAKGRAGQWLRWLRNLSLRHADAIVAIGDRMADRIAQEGVSRTAIHVIPNWADDEAIAPIPSSKSRLRVAYGFQPRDFVLGYSGNLGRAHEVETLIAAASLLCDRDDIRFLLIGGGSEYDRLWSFAAERRLNNFVFAPHQPREELADTLAAADAHWLSLRPELEGLIVPSKLFGILAAGRPVVAITAADGEVARIVREHRCGFVVEPGDAAALADCITTLADDHALARSLGERAREASKKRFSKASALKCWEQLLQGLASSPAR